MEWICASYSQRGSVKVREYISKLIFTSNHVMYLYSLVLLIQNSEILFYICSKSWILWYHDSVNNIYPASWYEPLRCTSDKGTKSIL